MSFLKYVVVAGATLTATVPAYATDIPFTFSDGATSYFYGRNHIGGTVTGILSGLTDNATSLPTSIMILTSPDALGFPEGTFSSFNFSGSPGITLTNGAVTGANLFANFNDGSNVGWQLRLNCTWAAACAGATGLNHLISNYDNPQNAGTGNQAGFVGASYTNAVAGVPEPATWAMMLVGFGAIGGALRRRQKVAARVQFA
jgi:hypothetical protein